MIVQFPFPMIMIPQSLHHFWGLKLSNPKTQFESLGPPNSNRFETMGSPSQSESWERQKKGCRFGIGRWILSYPPNTLGKPAQPLRIPRIGRKGNACWVGKHPKTKSYQQRYWEAFLSDHHNHGDHAGKTFLPRSPFCSTNFFHINRPGAEGSEQARPLRPRRWYCPVQILELEKFLQNGWYFKVAVLLKLWKQQSFSKDMSSFTCLTKSDLALCLEETHFGGKTIWEGFHLDYRMIIYFPP